MHASVRIAFVVALILASAHKAPANAATPAPSPPPAPTQGLCAQGALASISDRPGLGRAPASNGAACVALPGMVVVEAGYRNQVTAGPGTQTLATVPNAVIRVGLPRNNELLINPPTFSQRTGQDVASGFVPASGWQDSGIGFKHLLYDGTAFQDAVNLFVTFPTGNPGGASGFSAAAPTYTVGYSGVFMATRRVGLSSTQNFILNAAPDASGAAQRFFSYQPSVSFSYALSPNLSAMLQTQWSLPSGPGAGTGVRSLAGFQVAVSSGLVLDGEFEINSLPRPGLEQHAVDVGFTASL